MTTLAREFIQFALDQGVLQFGEFKTKAGRLSPYFFNSGQFNNGDTLMRLGDFYARALLDSGVKFSMIYGPAYKGIPLACATVIALANHGRSVDFAFNRKEIKDHGEGGQLIGAKLTGDVVIIDDVISAGTSVNESVEIIKHAGATPKAVLIALDRMERSGNATLLGEHSATFDITLRHQMPVLSIANLLDLRAYLIGDPRVITIDSYLEKYGAVNRQ